MAKCRLWVYNAEIFFTSDSTAEAKFKKGVFLGHPSAYASSQLGHLRTHLKIHSGEKDKQMQPVWLCILQEKQFEDTFEKT